MTEYELKEEIKSINTRLAYFKQYHSDSDDNPFGYGTVASAKANLRHRKKQLQEKLMTIKVESERRRAETKALYDIFDKHNGTVYPSDAGQDWKWRVEDGVVYCVIDGKEFSEPVEYPKS